MRTSGYLAAVLAGLVLLAGCATTKVPEKRSSADCLVVIKSRVEKPPNMEKGRDFYLIVSGQDRAVALPREKEGLVFIRVPNRNTRIEGVSSTVRGRWEGKGGRIGTDIRLPYDPGKVIIFDYVLVQRFELMEESMARTRVRSGVQFEKLREFEKKELARRIKESDELVGWR
jgi:hypothetical protein